MDAFIENIFSSNISDISKLNFTDIDNRKICFHSRKKYRNENKYLNWNHNGKPVSDEIF